MVYSSTTEVNVGGLDILFIPWINEQNSESSLLSIKSRSVKIRWGPLSYQDLGNRGHHGRRYGEPNYLRTTKWSSLVTITLDHPTGRSSTWEIPTRCSGTTSTTNEDSTSSTQKL